MQLNQVTVTVREIPRSIRFYERLGLQLIVKADHYARFVADNGATFSIHQGENPGGGTVVYFECENLDERCRQLQAENYVFEQLPFDQPWLWREAYLNDPDGNRICLYFAGEMRCNPPWRLATSL